MIEVVLNAETIANIQKEKGIFSATAAFKKGSLFSWLKDHNNTEELLQKACNEFTLSCAGEFNFKSFVEFLKSFVKIYLFFRLLRGYICAWCC